MDYTMQRALIALMLAAQAAANQPAIEVTAPVVEEIAPPAIVEEVEAPAYSDELVVIVEETPAETTPEAPSTGGQETNADANDVNPEMLDWVARLAGANAGNRGQQTAVAAQQQQAAQQAAPAVDAGVLNVATAEEQARLQAFLDAYPHGTVWNDKTLYKNNAGCAAYAIRAQETVYGADADYEWSNTLDSVRQYSAVEIRLSTGTHWIFVMKVNDDGTYQVAEGNVNGKVRIGCNYTLDNNCIISVWNVA